MIDTLRMKEVSFLVDWSAEAEGEGADDSSEDDDEEEEEESCHEDKCCGGEKHCHKESCGDEHHHHHDKESGEDEEEEWEDDEDEEESDSEDAILKMVRVSEEVQKMNWKDLIPKRWPNLHGTGFYATVSLTNHSCNPNISYDFPHSTNSVYMVATRDIKAGEEILMSYLSADDIQEDVETRRDVLEEWGFFCTCQRCLEEATALKKKKKSVPVGKRK
eukprot:GDKK01003418.1.p1 GENE.GDKK01003418.1~~GDKK01003418.1.p1  ORF type:complete len:238 (-),score=86.66 GDKK01003418.1:285-938(-)